MAKKGISWDLLVTVEEREGYFAATTKPLGITTYAKTEKRAEEKALKAVDLLMSQHRSNFKDMDSYLNRLGIKHRVIEANAEKATLVTRTPVMECKREMLEADLVAA